MLSYEQRALKDAENWQDQWLKRASITQRMAKKVQDQINNRIPVKVHQVVTESIKKMVEATVMGSNFTTKQKDVHDLSFEAKEELVVKVMDKYKKIAAVEGAGTGAGGIVWGLADFPLLLSIKMKCLFEIANLYGMDIKRTEERVFLLYIFHLAFCSHDEREKIMNTLETFEHHKKEMATIDWRTFQQEYRDYIDLVKLLQLVPGIGAAVGAYANYNLLDHLGEVAMNVYRLRLLKK
ncbi:EcsC family protein [Priestia koreensis]|uniref:EcsC n=1 Tax=Priestia koreensis TaxID=284581 RepID=A0A0M0LGX3_9BACI|nr:EcsC family protein [Priestia koreensis]KOO50221.1 ecsC [Priestia koreensis]